MTMPFMVLVKASKDSEAGVLPDERLRTEAGDIAERLRAQADGKRQP